MSKQTCVASVASSGGFHWHACGHNAKEERCGAPLCGTHARVFDRNHFLHVVNPYGVNGCIRRERPEGVEDRLRIEQWGGHGIPRLMKVDWDAGKEWEEASTDRRAVIVAFMDIARSYRARLMQQTTEVSDRLVEAEHLLRAEEDKTDGK